MTALARIGDVGKINLEVETRFSDQLGASCILTNQKIETCYSV